ncbi:rod shape-determining protein RodA [Pelagibacteraceae bacterium]|nr:rod shape-determining protein RodA [Pelagibacteraceae bacterium]
MSTFYQIKTSLSLIDKLKQINIYLLGLLSITFFFGLLSLYSVADANFNPWAKNHLIRFLVGLIIFFFICLIDIKLIIRLAYPLFFLNILALILILFIGTETYGATRWIRFAGLSLQPSEFIKVSLILCLAKYYHSIPVIEASKISRMVIPAVITLIPVGLVMIQPDLGTSIIILIGAGSIFWITGVNYKYFISAFGLVCAAIPVGWQYLHNYQKERVYTFFNPERDPLGNGYHIMQSKIALGSGGLSGKGYLEGTQSHLSFLPEMHTDFIFTMFGEEFGFLGTIFLLIIYFSIILLSFNLAIKSRNSFGKYLSCGLIFLFFIHVFINISMVMGLLPVVGVPLPLISYGGSSMLATMISFGLIMNCYINRDNIIAKEGFID